MKCDTSFMLKSVGVVGGGSGVFGFGTKGLGAKGFGAKGLGPGLDNKLCLLTH